MILDFFRFAVSSLTHRKLRTWLTMLGIFIGIAAVVALISLGQGLQEAINQQFEQLGKDKIVIQTKTIGPPGSATSESLILTSNDLKTIKNTKGVEDAAGIIMKSIQSKYKNEINIGFGIGTDPEDKKLFQEVQTFNVIQGRDLKKEDKYKVLVGYNHAVDGKIWKKAVKIGDTIQIEGTEFKVIGILEKIGNPFDDAALYMPKDTLKELLNIKDEESQIVAKVQKGFDPETVAEAIKKNLRKERNEEKDQETFTVQTSEQLLKTFTNIFGIVQAVLVGIAAISLLVGGIGIMNTMYTAVLERTREIGIMKAVGAKNSHILTIFLIESGLLGMIGGAIGVGIGVGIGKIVEIAAMQYWGTPLIRAVFPWYLILGALAFSFLIGTLSGVLPARQASRLKPVDALRYE